MFKWNLLYFNLHLLPLALSLSITEKTLGDSLSQVFIHAGKIPWTCSAPGWKIPTLLASSMSDAAAPSSPLWTCTGLIPAHPHLSGTEGPQHSTPDVFYQGWAEGKRLPSPACWQCSVWCSPGGSWPSLLPVAFAAPWSICSPGSTAPHIPRAALRSAPHLPVYGVIQPHADNVSWVQMEGLRNLLSGIHKSQQDLIGDWALCLYD